MSLPTDLLFTIAFDQTNDPANFKLTDTTDYSTLGIALANVRGNFTAVTDPLGNVIHNNTDYTAPDITASSTLIYTGINIPTDVSGEIIPGVYSFTYNIKVDNAITAVNQATPSFTIAGDYTSVISAGQTITVVRSTGNNGTYVVLTAVLVGTDTVITTTVAMPSGTADGAIQYSTQTTYTKTLTVTYADEVPVVEIGVVTDCFCGSLVSTDETDYGTATIISRTHTVKYPAALGINDVVSSNAIITITPIYTKTWTSIVTSQLSIPISGGTILATITGSEDTVVDCDLSLCDISCCVIALNNRYLDNRTANPSEAAKDFAKLTRMMQLIEIFTMAYKCDQHTEAAAALSEIKVVGNCTDACSCGDDEPTLVVPLCGSGNGVSYIQVTAGTGITVTTTMQNGNYIYQVGISASVMAMINAATPISLSGGTGITVSSAVVAGVTVWTITNSLPYTAQNRMEFICRLQYTSPTACTITNSAYLTSGANMAATATIVAQTIAVAGQNNVFRCSAFQVAANNNYKVTAQLIIATRGIGDYNYYSTKTLDLDILDKASGQFDFRFVSLAGFGLTNTGMSAYTDLFVHFKISE